jgi:16S rRNA (guanine(966)-N(2))-methyltransferase RsmD
MRIVGGQYKGRIFNPGKNFKARPTTDFAKESLFDILANRYDFGEISVLDLFSGTGSISYEFASRGCNRITLVESDFVHYRFITQTLAMLKTRAVSPVKADVFSFIKKCRGKFDLVFADPPYQLQNLKDIPDLILSSGILSPEGIFILEHPKNYDFGSHPMFFELRYYGSVHFSFFKAKQMEGA